MNQWKQVVFSDEINIEVDNRINRVMFIRMTHDKYNDNCVLIQSKQESGSIGIWACMNYYGVGFFKIYDYCLMLIDKSNFWLIN